MLYNFLPRFSCTGTATHCTDCLENCASKTSKLLLEICAKTAIRPPWNTCPRCRTTLPWNSCPNYLELCASPCCTDLLKCCLGMRTKVLFSFSSLLRNFLCSLLLLLSICSWKNEFHFPSFSSFNLTLSDFWGIPKSNGWDSEIALDLGLRLNAHLNLTFYFFNSPHFNKDPLSHSFPKSLFTF